MKMAITGKGGAGKTTIAGIVIRSLAQRGMQVVAVDADPNPNLGLSLGLSDEQLAKVDGIVNVLIRERSAHKHSHDVGDHDHSAEQPCDPPPMRTADEIVADMGVTGPDGVILVETGRIERPSEGCLCCGSHGTTRRIFGDLSHGSVKQDAVEQGVRVVVADLEAGVNDLIWAEPTSEDIVLVVTEPYIKSLEVARRAIAVAQQLGVQRLFCVANRIETQADVDRIREVVGDVPMLQVPDDPDVAKADRAGVPPIDIRPLPAAVRAVQGFLDQVVSSPS